MAVVASVIGPPTFFALRGRGPRRPRRRFGSAWSCPSLARATPGSSCRPGLGADRRSTSSPIHSRSRGRCSAKCSAADFRIHQAASSFGLAEVVPGLEHDRATGVGLDPGDDPRLIGHRGQECRVEGVDVDLVALVGAGLDPLELGRASASQVPRWATTSRTVQPESS